MEQRHINDGTNKKETVTQTIPVIEEHVKVDKKEVYTGKVVISKSVEHHTEPVHVVINHDEVTVTHMPAGYYVEKAPEVRYEGDVMIIPVLKEEAVVVKKIYLVEELHVTRVTRQTQDTQNIELRKEYVDITRVKADEDDQAKPQ
jgi:uncharacterized protein (TIGR02271 family)